MLHSSNPLRIPCLALCLAFPLAALVPARAADDPAFSAQPVAVNQVGYQTGWPKRFTAPRSPDGTTFIVRHAKGTEPVFKGQITGQLGDFSDFRPADSDQEYVIVLNGGGADESVSYPFSKGAFRHPEGWVNFNAAWNLSLAYFVWDPAQRAPAKKP